MVASGADGAEDLENWNKRIDDEICLCFVIGNCFFLVVEIRVWLFLRAVRYQQV